MLRTSAILLILAGALGGCRNKISEIKAITDPQNYPVQTSEQAEYTFTEHGKLRNRLIAAKLEQFHLEEETYMIASGGFTLVFYDSTETEEARLNAAHGRYDQNLQRLRAWENVELFNSKGEKLETEELIFVQDSSKIYTNRFVKITTLSGVIYGEGMESNDSFTSYRILQPSGDIYIND